MEPLSSVAQYLFRDPCFHGALPRLDHRNAADTPVTPGAPDQAQVMGKAPPSVGTMLADEDLPSVPISALFSASPVQVAVRGMLESAPHIPTAMPSALVVDKSNETLSDPLSAVDATAVVEIRS